MNTHADKPQKNKCQSAPVAKRQMQSSSESPFQFVDNRLEAVAQRKLQEMAKNSPRAMQLKAFQDMPNHSQRTKQAAQFRAVADNHVAQPIQKQGLEEEGLLQGKFESIQKKQNKTGLPDHLKTGLENLSGMSLDDVKVHRNSAKPAQLQAHAYAKGTAIHLGPGQEKHLPHEAWHVVQQKQGRVKPTLQMKGKVNINDDAGLEKEADIMGKQALDSNQKTKADINNNSLDRIPIKQMATVQRTEAAAIALAQVYDPTIVNWANVITARGPGGVGVPPTVIDLHWPAIIAAYVAPPAGGRNAAALIAESNALIATGDWAVLQRIKEASELLERLQEEKQTKQNLLRSQNPDGSMALAPLMMHVTAAEIPPIELAINNLQVHFMMPTRTEEAGGPVGKGGLFSSAKKATVLGFEGGTNLELHNRINPETKKEQGLGKGGFGYGKFGKVGDQTKFVKKIRLRTEKNVAASPARVGAIDDPYALPADLASEMAPGLTGELRGIRREATLTRQGGVLDHPNIVATEAAGIRPGKDGKLKAYMVQEKMEGDVSGIIKAGKIPRASVINLIRGTLNAVVHMHANNYLHRDIKPDNIMIDSTGAPKLIDFGTAALMVGGVFNSPTAEGTREFMHPDTQVAPAPPGGYDYRVSTDIQALKLTFLKLVGQSPESVDIGGWVAGIDVDNSTTAALLAGFNFA
ncbi:MULTISPECIES: protein kinase domain-containing protein [Rhodonellum]|nr:MULTISPECIES: DUF4157 domain-containing protein [Rhodonellum]